MLLLAFEAAGPGTSVALLEVGADGPARVLDLRHDAARGAGDRLIPLIQATLGSGRAAFSDVGALAVDRGPGGFTGVRTAVAAARGLALALRCPLIAITRFQVLASVHAPGPDEVVAVAIDGGRGRVQLQAFAFDLEPLAPPLAVAPERGLEGLPRPLRLTGSGAQLLVEAASDRRGVEVVASDADAGSVGRLAARRLHAGLAQVQPFTLEPLYLRPPDAVPPRRRHERPDPPPAHARAQT